MLFTPGHAPGHICLHNEEQNIIIGGDLIFKEGIGRFDLPGGDYNVLIQSIKEKILSESLLNTDDIKDIDKTIDTEMDVSMNYAINSPLNDESEIFTDVYDQSYKIESVDSLIKNILKQ